MKAVKLLTVGLALASALSLIAQPKFADVAKEAKQAVVEAQQELATLRSRIADEKIPISRTLTQLESQVQEKRSEFERVVS
ncbi:MAG: hypothetical protein OSB19_18245, partial [Opitutaceae bacterium]|nr:hypothetical protein [Opitutaceae bacterium]